MKRFLALIFVYLLAVSVFAGCGGTKGGNDVSSVLSIDPDTVIDFATKGFSVVREESNGDASALAVKIIKALKKNCNVSLKNLSDEAEENVVGEILIGNTNRKESQKCIDLIYQNGNGRRGDYAIAFIDGKIVINSISPAVLETAVDKFIELYCNSGTMKAGDRVIYNDPSDKYINITLNGVDISHYKVIVPKYNVSYLVTRRAQELCDIINERGGYGLRVERDSVSPSEYEIIIDNCDREGVEAVEGAEKYIIKNDGKKIYINGGKNYSVASALQRIINNFNYSDTLVVENIQGSYNGNLDYNYVWGDEFNEGESYNKAFWNDTDYADPTLGGFYDLIPYRSDSLENIYIENGALHQKATFDNQYFYGTFMNSRNKVMFTYGLAEISSKLADGEGIWHCFWLWDSGITPNGDLLEFDVMECWSGSQYYVSVIHETINGTLVDEATSVNTKHSYVTIDSVFKNDSGMEFWAEQKKDRRPERLMSEQYHTFAVQWDEESVTMIRDGEVTLFYNYKGTQNEHLYKNPHYIILSMAVGSNKSNADDDISNDHKSMVGVKRPIIEGEGSEYWYNGKNIWSIDYINIFQKDGWYFEIK